MRILPVVVALALLATPAFAQTSTVFLGAQPLATSISPSDRIPVTQGYTGSGTGVLRSATPAQITAAEAAARVIAMQAAIPAAPGQIMLGTSTPGQTIAVVQGTKVFLDASQTMWVMEDSNSMVVIGTGTTRLFSIAPNGNFIVAGTITLNGTP